MGDSRGTSFIYFIQSAPGGAIKIGVSRKPLKRIKAIATGNPGELKILAIVPGTIREERALHTLFASSRVRLEWFAASPALQALITDARAAGILPEHKMAQALDANLKRQRRRKDNSKDTGLRAWRKEHGVSLREIGGALNLSINTVANIETGKSFPTMRVICLVEGFTSGAIGIRDHADAWVAANIQQYVKFRADGRAAAKAFRTPSKTRKK